MNDRPVRIAMWSGPRNISTAMMRSFENRQDTAVVDEPFYAAFLALSGIDHPLRETVLKKHETDWRRVANDLVGAVPGGRGVFYQKHMTHHMLPEIGRDWMQACVNAFLIRSPEQVLASYSAKRADVTLSDIGFVQQRELFEREADRLGHAPPVVEAEDILADPAARLRSLCDALGIPFSERMLHWPAGPRATDGAWAPVWYDAVERSTGFAKPRLNTVELSGRLRAIADAARPHYERLAAFKLAAQPSASARSA